MKFHTNLLWQIVVETFSLLRSISELKIFFVSHSIQMLNRSFHLGLVSEVCEISYKFILANCLETLSLPKSIIELKIFVEYRITNESQ